MNGNYLQETVDYVYLRLAAKIKEGVSDADLRAEVLRCLRKLGDVTSPAIVVDFAMPKDSRDAQPEHPFS